MQNLFQIQWTCQTSE